MNFSEQQKNTKIQGGSGMAKVMRQKNHNRRALSVINQNLAGAPPSYPCVVKNKHSKKFASEITVTQQHSAQESESQIPPDDEEQQQKKGAIDHHEPMFLEPTDELVLTQEDDQMEVEMEDIFEEPVMDIDGCDARNPLAVVDYVEDLYAYYRKMEICSCVSPNYMAQQFEINGKMRAILIDWLIEVHHKFDLREETLFLTVNIIDRFLAKEAVVKKELQLVGLVAMLLACKYEEVSVPIVEDLVYISDKAYTRKQILHMEKLMVNTLQFNMSVPTPYVFMNRFLKAAQTDRKLELLSFFLVELCLVEYEMLKFPPSLLAAAAIYTAQCTLYGFKQWTKTCEWFASYSDVQLLECCRLMVGYHQKAATGRLTGVHRKYNTSKFGYAAKCEAALFLLMEAPK